MQSSSAANTLGRLRRWAGRDRSQAPGILGRLRERLGELRRLSAGTESLFLEFARLVRELSADSEALVARSEALIRMSLGQDDCAGILSGAAEALATPLEQEAAARQRTGQMLRRLAESGQRISEVGAARRSLHDAMTVMRVIQVMFRTEAAALEQEARAMFETLSAEIVDLEDGVNRAFNEKFATLDETQAALDRALAAIAGENESRSRQCALTKNSIEAGLGKVDELISRNRAREVDLLQVSRGVATEIGRIVMGLQVHDIVSQKLAHVEAALDQLEGELHAGQGAGTAECAAAIEEVCRIQAAQLGAVAGDLNTTAETLAASAAGVLRKVSAFDADDAILKQFDAATSSAAEMVQVLLDSIAEVGALMQSAGASAGNSRRSIQPISEALDDLNMAVGEVAQRISLVALNAQVQAAQRGSSTGLEVLAGRVAEISRQTEAAGQLTTQAAGQTTARVAEAVHELAAIEAEMQRQQAEFAPLAEREEERLHSLRDRMLMALREVGDRIEGIRVSTAAISGCSGELRRPLELVEAAQKALLDAAGEAGRLRGGYRGSGSGSIAERLRLRYTMSAERDVHQAVLAGVEQAPVAAGSIAAGEVELF